MSKPSKSAKNDRSPAKSDESNCEQAPETEDIEAMWEELANMLAVNEHTLERRSVRP